jgi:hypothetical protein
MTKGPYCGSNKNASGSDQAGRLREVGQSLRETNKRTAKRCRLPNPLHLRKVPHRLPLLPALRPLPPQDRHRANGQSFAATN